jgi:hypothetical protein
LASNDFANGCNDLMFQIGGTTRISGDATRKYAHMNPFFAAVIRTDDANQRDPT